MKPWLLSPDEAEFDLELDVVVVGGGGCGLCAALAASESGAEVVVLERDPTPLGTTSMSTGLIPAAGSSFQRNAGIEDSPALFTQDVMTKTHKKADEQIVLHLARQSAPTIEWLVEQHQIPLTLVEGFTYPGHSVMRMHGMPSRSGQELMGALQGAVESLEIPVLTNAEVTQLIVDSDNRVQGVRYQSPDGEQQDVACKAVVLACCGFAGNAEMVAEYIPEIASGVFHGHPGNKGQAIKWGQAMGAALADMHAYQGHAGLAKGYGIPILWPIIMEGGVQINRHGQRFSNEASGYSEQAVNVLAQPGHDGWTFFDERLHRSMLDFADYQHALEVDAIKSANSIEEMATLIGLPEADLHSTLMSVKAHCRENSEDEFGRQFSSAQEMKPPYYAVKVTGALFHTQGGLVVDENARVVNAKGEPLPNLYAGGGAARGISGVGADGYLAGNGLLTATTFGRLAGTHAAKSINT